MKTALALGTFDGLHIAHRKVLDLPQEYKKTAVTFTKPPKMYFSNKNDLIFSYEDKVKMLKKLGFSEVAALNFEEVRDVQPLDFLERLYSEYKPALISCGFNYRFGKGGLGDTEFLQKFCDDKGIQLKICQPVTYNGEAVSSTLIRNMLKAGNIEAANTLLYEPFGFSAEVIKGDKRGRTIGFPTINQKYPENLIKIKFGVYQTKVEFNCKSFVGVTNIGIRPTFESDYVICETYIKDFSDDLYGKTVKIIPQKFLREEIKFSSLEDLKKQLDKDINQIK